ncbi:sporulation protein YunB [Bacillus sp. CGMCC 1.16541]|uniref:sporulation protein YunB n=1 Tax=Bacillus sp. CGMCC 1.16541 TaxID=2185143 RepID=UPI000D73383C|nr:sporulation protein YunB [Bacillus sp. CGMCC 1.16541]
MPKFRRKLFRKGPLPFRYVFLLTFVFFIFSTASGLWFINKGIEPTLMDYAEAQTKRIATLVINKAVNKQITEELDTSQLVNVEKNANGEVTFIGINAPMVSRALAQTTNLVQANLRAVEKGEVDTLDLPMDVEIETDDTLREKGIIYQVPLGQATDNALLGNLGPLVPVKFHAIGYVNSDVKEVIEEYGINNAVYKIVIHVEVNVQVIIPFSTKMTTVTTDIPIVMQVLPGGVPDYYNKGGDSSPAIQLPKKSN